MKRPRGSGQIEARGPNKWRVRWYGGLDQETGKPIYPSKVIHGTKSEAEMELAKVNVTKEAGTYQAPTKLTVAEWMPLWFSGKLKITAKTKMDYKLRMETDIIPAFGRVRIDHLTRAMVQQWVGRLESEKDYSRRTIQYSLTILSQAMKQAWLDGKIERNPCIGIELPKEQKEEPRVWSVAEIQQFMAFSCTRRVLWDTMLAGGLRLQEVVALKWSDIDFTAMTITIRRAMKQVTKSRWEPGEPKSKNGWRTLEMPTDYMEALRNHKATQAASILKAGAKYKRQDWVFAGTSGDPLDMQTLRRAWHRDLERAKMPVISVHKARHSHGTMLIKANVNPKVGADRLGIDVQVFLRIYAHVLKDMSKVASDATSTMLYQRAL